MKVIHLVVITESMKSVIISIVRELSSEGLKIKKLKKLTLAKVDDDSSAEDEDFDEVFEKLQSKGKIVVDEDGLVSIAEEKSSKRKRDDEEPTETATKHTKATSGGKSASAVTTSAAANYPKELWKTGEMLWRENGFDYEYLRTNPENITRLFCGNLSKTVTEEQLKSCIEGITYIKWITDKETKQFYGSTFIQVKDPKAAIEAVMKDKQKFMGRFVFILQCLFYYSFVLYCLMFVNAFIIISISC